MPAQSVRADTWQIAAENRDAWDDTGSGNLDLADFGDSFWNDSAGYQWAATIPKGAFITSAKLRVYSNAHIGQNAAYTARIRVEDVDDAVAFNGSPNDIRGRTYWSNTVDWNIPFGGLAVGSYNDSPDISSLIQHIVDRPGWTPGNHVGVAVWGQTISGAGGAREQIADWPSNPAELIVTYEPRLPIYRSIGTAANYAAGSVTATLGSRVVTGTGTSWKSANRGRGDRININGTNYTVLWVNSDTSLTLKEFATASYSGTSYSIARQFGTLAAWENCIDGSGNGGTCAPFPEVTSNLITDDRSEVGVAYEDSVFTTALLFSGTTTDATHDIVLTADGDNRHYGIIGQGVVLDNGANAADAIEINDDFVTVEWFEITGGGAEGITVSSLSVANHVIIRAILLQGVVNGDAILTDDANGVIDIYNNIVYNSDEGIRIGGTFNAGAQVRILNNTVYDMLDKGVVSTASPNTQITLRNNLVYGSPTSDFQVPLPINPASSNNMGSDGSGATHNGFDTAQSAAMIFVNPGAGDLHVRTGSDAENAGADLSGIFSIDIDNAVRQTTWDIGADDIAATTAVELMSFEARPLDEAVELRWETGSELDNLGFHLYRATSEQGPFERVSPSVIPGLGSSPEGAAYVYRDEGLANGVTYYYELEDIETNGRTARHGPIASTAGPSALDDNTDSSLDTSRSRITYGDPTANSFRVVPRGRGQWDLELSTEGFFAEPNADGSVRILIPDFEAVASDEGPELPVRRSWVEVLAGRKVKLVSVETRRVVAFTSLRPSDIATPEIIATGEGIVRAARGRQRKRAALTSDDLYPSSAANIVSVGFQADVKKALVELAPLRWDESGRQLLLARRLVVRLSAGGRDPGEVSTDGVRGRRNASPRGRDTRDVVARLLTKEKGLHGIRYEEVMRGRRGVRTAKLRLSRQGEAVAFHVEPRSDRFSPGSVLYFVGDGAAANPFGDEAVYELELNGRGPQMSTLSAAPSGTSVVAYWHQDNWEEDRYYQSALLDAPDRWLWDSLFAPESKSYPIEVSALAPGGHPAKLSVWLQGASDFQAAPDHHVRVRVNGRLVEESSWDGKRAKLLEAELPPGLLREGANLLELENVGDTEASQSMVMLDRFTLEYARLTQTQVGRVEGQFREAGTADLSGLDAGAMVLDTSDTQPIWLTDTDVGTDGVVRFRAESGRSYLAVSSDALYRPAVRKPEPSRLRANHNRADYLLIGPAAFLEAAKPLLELRRTQGLRDRAVSVEAIYSDFGFGEPTPRAIQDFLSYAYHHWKQPAPRYVVLLGDATYDFKNNLQTGVKNQVPPLLVRTSYLWTASDPSYAAVNGDDPLPDLAIGRLPAATVEQARAMVEKIVNYETSGANLGSSAVVLVADNTDAAGSFEADADRLASSVLASKNPEKIYVSQLGADATRNAILQRFDEGASLVSYTGHGGIRLWASENVFNANDVHSLAPQSQQPLVLTMNCLNGYFHFPYFDSLAEALVKEADKGAIAAFAPSGLSLHEAANKYHSILLEELLSGRHHRLGDAVLRAQERYAETGAFPELVSIYHLLGDPALGLQQR